MSVGEKPVTAMLTDNEINKIKALAEDELKDVNKVIPAIIEKYNELGMQLQNNIVLIVLMQRKTTDSGLIKNINETSTEAIEERANSYHYVIDYDISSDFPVCNDLGPGVRVAIGSEPFRFPLPDPILLDVETAEGKKVTLKYDHLYALFMHDVLATADGVQV